MLTQGTATPSPCSWYHQILFSRDCGPNSKEWGQEWLNKEKKGEEQQPPPPSAADISANRSAVREERKSLTCGSLSLHTAEQKAEGGQRTAPAGQRSEGERQRVRGRGDEGQGVGDAVRPYYTQSLSPPSCLQRRKPVRLSKTRRWQHGCGTCLSAVDVQHFTAGILCGLSLGSYPLISFCKLPRTHMLTRFPAVFCCRVLPVR